jgi:hypothetical protein
VPWFKCSHCRIRRSGVEVAISAAQERCPLCGRELTPEHDLTSLVGFSFLSSGRPPAAADAIRPLPSAPDVEAVYDTLAGRRGLDGGDSGGSRKSPW